MKKFKVIDAWFSSEHKKKNKCNHNPYDVNSTLQEVKKRVMISPDTKYFMCNECHQGFKFVKNEDGDFVEESVPVD